MFIPDSRTFSSLISDPGSYVLPVCKKGVAKVNLLFLAAYGFMSKFFRVAQFHKDTGNITRILKIM
jgi:hypothetical protein